MNENNKDLIELKASYKYKDGTTVRAFSIFEADTKHEKEIKKNGNRADD